MINLIFSQYFGKENTYSFVRSINFSFFSLLFGFVFSLTPEKEWMKCTYKIYKTKNNKMKRTYLTFWAISWMFAVQKPFLFCFFISRVCFSFLDDGFTCFNDKWKKISFLQNLTYFHPTAALPCNFFTLSEGSSFSFCLSIPENER